MTVDERYHGRHRTATGRRLPLPLVADDVTVDVVTGGGTRRILDRVSLALQPGTFTALIGPSGAGKTTLLWSLAGTLAPTSGTVRYDGRLLDDQAPAAREGILLVPQGVALMAPLTARENVLLPLLVHRVPAAEAGARADAALGDVLLGESGDHLVEELSGGQQQRVGVARVLALRPSVLLADEPTSELDAGTRETVVDLMAAEARAGALVLMATHDPWCADRADAEYHLDEGRLSRIR